MSAQMRAKFAVQRVETAHTTDGTPTSQHVVASPVFKNQDPDSENSRFWTATPSGQIDLYISNVDAFGFFQAGDLVYVDFTKTD